MLPKKIMVVLYLLIAISYHVQANYYPNYHRVGSPSTKTTNNTDLYSVVVIGAFGDISTRLIYPALWKLYLIHQLPVNIQIYGFGRRDLKVDDLRKKVEPYVNLTSEQEWLYNKFWSKNHYLRNIPSEIEGYDNLCNTISKAEKKCITANRIFFLAQTPKAYEISISNINRACQADKGWTRLVVEKPFGRDLRSSERLTNQLSNLFTEDEVYYLDRYLGEEMVQNIPYLRFTNRLLTPGNQNNVASVKIDYRENVGVENRGDFFDSYGIIRDVIVTHLIQILSLIGMEPPASMEPDDVRAEKVKFLKSIKPVDSWNFVLGQYEGYQKEPGVRNDSRQVTLAAVVLEVDNDRWRGVPFILQAGKGLNEKSTEIVVKYKNVNNNIFNQKLTGSKLIVRIGDEQFINRQIMSKKPGFSSDIELIDLKYSYEDKHKGLVIPSAYEKLILDVFRGSELNFVSSKEINEAWRIFTPLLQKIENRKLSPIKYKFGSTGRKAADKLEQQFEYLI